MIASPLVEFFKRGEVARDVRLLAAQGGFAPRAHEQLSILVLLLEDPYLEVRQTADATLNRLPADALSRFLARPDVSVTLRDFFAARGVAVVAGAPAEDPEAPLVDVDGQPGDEDLLAEGDTDQLSVSQKIAKMTFTQRLKAASKGTREMRAILVRDTNKMIAAAVMSSPKLTEQEVESISRMASVSEDVLRMIAHCAWMKSYKVVLGLVKNPKTPVALSMNLLQRVSSKDCAQIALDRNVPEPLRLAARKKTVEKPNLALISSYPDAPSPVASARARPCRPPRARVRPRCSSTSAGRVPREIGLDGLCCGAVVEALDFGQFVVRRQHRKLHAGSPRRRPSVPTW